MLAFTEVLPPKGIVLIWCIGFCVQMSHKSSSTNVVTGLGRENGLDMCTVCHIIFVNVL